ncbi:MAG: hypothetical protein RLZ33_459 [Bacteroidota bacterium]
MRYLLVSFVLLFVVACSQTPTKSSEDENNGDTNKTLASEKYEVITTENPDQSFGYQILKDGKLMIDQKNIPAIQGNRGFSSKSDAEKIANFAIDKIKKGAFPPTISVEELDSLGIIK